MQRSVLAGLLVAAVVSITSGSTLFAAKESARKYKAALMIYGGFFHAATLI